MDPTLALLRDELKLALGHLDEQQTQLRPTQEPESWTVQQIVRHLGLTYAATTEAMEARIAKRSPTRAKPTIAQRVAQFGIIRLGYFPSGRKAPDRVSPGNERELSGVLLAAHLHDALQQMDQAIAAAEALFGPAPRAISHMALGPLSTEQWRRFHLVHGRHHIKQIRAIRLEHNV